MTCKKVCLVLFLILIVISHNFPERRKKNSRVIKTEKLTITGVPLVLKAGQKIPRVKKTGMTILTEHLKIFGIEQSRVELRPKAESQSGAASTNTNYTDPSNRNSEQTRTGIQSPGRRFTSVVLKVEKLYILGKPVVVGRPGTSQRAGIQRRIPRIIRTEKLTITGKENVRKKRRRK